MKTVKLKVLGTFYDKEIDSKRFKNQEFECSEERAKEILAFEKYQLVEVLSIIKN